ncbi:hypothetical protein [Streptomyces prunicolor]|uniref:hypothetical protein n=1 Tax=Streptomyces prunicolor TaxID=67348 RepID=UPI00037CF166|nr:hypothetical protein [Streptomyces prunicolor]
MRRDKAADLAGIGADRFRKHQEKLLVRQVAEAILAGAEPVVSGAEYTAPGSFQPPQPPQPPPLVRAGAASGGDALSARRGDDHPARGAHRTDRAGRCVGVVGEHLLRDVQDVPPHDLREPAAGQERDSGGLPLRSVALPLFGAGRGGLDARKSAEAVLGALEIALAADPDWPVHLVTRNPVSAAAVLEALAARRR